MAAETSWVPAGALEVQSNGGLTVSWRTYSLADEGTFVQSLDGVTSAEGLDQGAAVFLQQLGEDSTFRANISALNTGCTSSLMGRFEPAFELGDADDSFVLWTSAVHLTAMTKRSLPLDFAGPSCYKY